MILFEIPKSKKLKLPVVHCLQLLYIKYALLFTRDYMSYLCKNISNICARKKNPLT